MDCDMIVKTDIARLYYEDLGENVIGGVNDIVLQGWLMIEKIKIRILIIQNT